MVLHLKKRKKIRAPDGQLIKGKIHSLSDSKLPGFIVKNKNEKWRMINQNYNFIKVG